MIYLIVLILLLLGLKYDFRLRSKSADRYYVFECLVLILLMGLRYHVGGDSIRYESYFEYSRDIKDILVYGIVEGGFQPGWLILQGLSKTLVDDFVFFQLVHCTIVVGGIFFLANKHCKHRFTFVVLFYLSFYPYFCTEIMREALAVVCFIFGIDSLAEKKYIRYFLICAIAFLFHAGAIFLFALPFVYEILSKPSSFRQVIFIAALVFIIVFMFEFLLGFITETIFSGNQLLEKKSEDLSESSSLNIFGIISTLIGYFYVLITYRYLRLSSLSASNSHFVVSMYLITIILSIFYIPLSRVQNYFVISFLFVFADFLYDPVIVRKYNSLLKLSICLLLYSRLSYYVSDIRAEDSSVKPIKFYQLYFPYSSILNPKENADRETFIENQF